MERIGDVKKRIRALLTSSPGGCSPRQLFNDYKEVIGTDVPYAALGYRSLMSFIRDIPDVVSVKLTRDNQTVLYAVPDENTIHITRMVARQKRSCQPRARSARGPPPPVKEIPSKFHMQLKTLFLSYPNGIPLERFGQAFAQRFGYYLNFRAWGFGSLEELMVRVPGVTVEKDPLRGSAVLKRKREATAAVQKREPPQDSLHSLETSSPKEKKSFPSVPTTSTSPAPPADTPQVEERPPIPQRLIQHIKELLEANPAGIWLSQFSSQFKDYYGEELPVFTQGYSTVLHLLSSLPDCCSIERPRSGTGDWLVVATGRAVKVALNHGHTPSAYISEALSSTVTRLLATQPEGIPLSKFLYAYKEYTHKDLDVKELGFNSLVELLRRVEGVSVEKPPDTSFMMVHSAKARRRGRKNESCSSGMSSGSEEPPKAPGTMVSAYKKQSIPTSKMLGVYITHVHTPSCMSVQIIGESTTRTLEYLLEDLTQFYNSREGDAYILKRPQIGQPCCTVFNNDGYWYRGEVRGLPSPDITEVLYVDYGNTGRVPATSLRRPKPHYMTLPSQAVQCRLANLKPAGSTWSVQAAQLLFQMTKDKPIVAIVTSTKDGILSACLCDTTTEEDIHINDTLVSQGLAIFEPDTEEEEAKYDNYQLQGPPQGATGDHVPSVRVPSNEGKVASSLCPPPVAASPPVSLSASASPPGLPSLTTHTVTPSQPPTPTPTQLMHSYLLNQQLLLQQRLLTGLTGFSPSDICPTSMPPGIVPFPMNTAPTGQTSQAGYNLVPNWTGQTGIVTPAAVPTLTSSASHSGPSAVTQSHQTGQTSIQPVQPATNHSGQLPSQAQPMPRANPSTRGGGRSEERVVRGEGGDSEVKKLPVPDPSSLLWVKRLHLTSSHVLHILRHNSRAYVLSQEVSKWFWDTDLLQSMLRQVQKPVWGLLLQDHRASKLFTVMRSIPYLRAILYGRREVTVYALEDLPLIVSTFHAPEHLCVAVREEAGKWLKESQHYFTKKSDKEMEKVTAALKELQVKRRQILSAMAEQEEEEDGDLQQGTLKLIEVNKAITNLKAKRTRLLQQATGQRGGENGAEGTKSETDAEMSRQDSGSEVEVGSRDTQGSWWTGQSTLNNPHQSAGSSLVSDSDDTFYSLSPSSLSPLPPAAFPTVTSSMYSTNSVYLSPSSSSSSSLSSLSDFPDTFSLPPNHSATHSASHLSPDSPPLLHSDEGKDPWPIRTAATGQYGNRTTASEQNGIRTTASGPYGNRTTAYGNRTATSKQYGNTTTVSGQYGNKTTASGQYGNKTTVSGQYGNKTTVSGQYGNRGAASEQYGKRTTVSGQYGNRTVTSEQYGNRTSISGCYSEHVAMWPSATLERSPSPNELSLSGATDTSSPTYSLSNFPSSSAVVPSACAPLTTSITTPPVTTPPVSTPTVTTPTVTTPPVTTPTVSISATPTPPSGITMESALCEVEEEEEEEEEEEVVTGLIQEEEGEVKEEEGKVETMAESGVKEGKGEEIVEGEAEWEEEREVVVEVGREEDVEEREEEEMEQEQAEEREAEEEGKIEVGDRKQNERKVDNEEGNHKEVKEGETFAVACVPGSEGSSQQPQLPHPSPTSSPAQVKEMTSVIMPQYSVSHPTPPQAEPSKGRKLAEGVVEDKLAPPPPKPASSVPLPTPYLSPNAHPQLHFINSPTEQFIGWKNRRSIGLGRGRPSDNPRAFMCPGYRSPYLQPSVGTIPSVPSTPYYSGSWQH